MSKPKLGVIVPYRDRYEQLFKFKSSIHFALSKQGIPYELILVEQDNEKVFNRGKLLNIGVLKAKELKCEYVVLHDIDMLPTNVDYSFTTKPVHLATQNIPFPQYFGGITLFPIETFFKINGFSNEYWGWGFEDDDLLFRCRLHGIPLKQHPYQASSGNTSALKFNGNSAHVKIDNHIRTRGDFSITVTCQPEDLTLDHTKDKDNFTMFGIPGYDFNIMYTSFQRYTVELFDADRVHHYLNTKAVSQIQCNITITWDNQSKVLTLYHDGIKAASKTIPKGLRNYQSQKSAYIGASFPARKGEENYFRGRIQETAIWESALKPKEVHAVATNHGMPLGMDFENYESSATLQHHYTTTGIRGYKLIDLGNRETPGNLIDVEIVPWKVDVVEQLAIPYRRDSRYTTLQHDENGFLHTGWKDITTRFNQLKFINEVRRGYRKTAEDGIDNCDFVIHNTLTSSNFHHLTVKL